MLTFNNKYITIAAFLLGLYIIYGELAGLTDRRIDWEAEKRLHQVPILDSNNTEGVEIMNLEKKKDDRTFFENIMIEGVLEDVPKGMREELKKKAQTPEAQAMELARDLNNLKKKEK